MTQAALTYAQNHQTDFLEDLKTLLRIPSISTQSDHNTDIEKAAQWLADKMTAIGLKQVALYPTAKHPVVYGEWLEAGPDAPTALIYGHYDVQPPDPLNLWETPPFEPTVRGDNLFARGATDDKGQIFIHLAAVESVLQAEGKLPINVKFMIEGEEEIGSLNLGAFIAAHANLLTATCALISDTAFTAPGQPALVYGLRGLAAFEIEVHSARQDMHSGLYGGAVHNPLVALAEIIAGLHDEACRVTIPGFYDEVVPLEEEERRLLAQTPNTIRQETGIKEFWGEPAYTPTERTTVRPTLEVHGIVGGYTGEGTKTVIPAWAKAKITMRLVSNQTPQKMEQLLTDYIRQITPNTVTTKVTASDKGLPALVNRHDPAVTAASQAYEQTFGRGPVFIRSGGSIPVVPLLQHHLDLPVVMMGFGLMDDNLHAPNEKFYLPNFFGGIEAAIRFMHLYASKS